MRTIIISLLILNYQFLFGQVPLKFVETEPLWLKEVNVLFPTLPTSLPDKRIRSVSGINAMQDGAYIYTIGVLNRTDLFAVGSHIKKIEIKTGSVIWEREFSEYADTTIKEWIVINEIYKLNDGNIEVLGKRNPSRTGLNNFAYIFREILDPATGKTIKRVNFDVSKSAMELGPKGFGGLHLKRFEDSLYLFATSGLFISEDRGKTRITFQKYDKNGNLSSDSLAKILEKLRPADTVSFVPSYNPKLIKINENFTGAMYSRNYSTTLKTNHYNEYVKINHTDFDDIKIVNRIDLSSIMPPIIEDNSITNRVFVNNGTYTILSSLYSIDSLKTFDYERCYIKLDNESRVISYIKNLKLGAHKYSSRLRYLSTIDHNDYFLASPSKTGRIGWDVLSIKDTIVDFIASLTTFDNEKTFGLLFNPYSFITTDKFLCFYGNKGIEKQGSFTITKPYLCAFDLQKLIDYQTSTENIKSVLQNFILKPTLTDQFIILKLDTETKGIIKIINEYGQEVNQMNITSLETQVDVSNFPQGLYYIGIYDDYGTQIFKIKEFVKVN